MLHGTETLKAALFANAVLRRRAESEFQAAATRQARREARKALRTIDRLNFLLMGELLTLEVSGGPSEFDIACRVAVELPRGS